MAEEERWSRTHRFELWMGVSVALAILLTAGVSSWVRWPGWVHSLDWVDWGNAPAWIGSLLTALAVSVALWVAVAGSRERRQDDRRRSEAEERDRRAQLRLLTVEPHMLEKYLGTGAHGSDTEIVPGIRITNHSALPFFKFTIRPLEHPPGYSPLVIAGRPMDPSPVAASRVLVPDAHIDVFLDDHFPSPPTGDKLLTLSDHVRFLKAVSARSAVIEVTDAAGFEWMKTVDTYGSVRDIIEEQPSD